LQDAKENKKGKKVEDEYEKESQKEVNTKDVFQLETEIKV